MHSVSDFIDSIKESLTDGQYKEGMELCQALYKKKEFEKKLFRMTYLAPYTFASEHCANDDCDDRTLQISFRKKTSLIMLSDERAARIRAKNIFCGESEEMAEFIDVDVLLAFPIESVDLGMELEWFEFPVLSLELCESSCDLHT
jgi:hypothetical protein